MERLNRNVDSVNITIPIHFFTIILNGQPFIRYHIKEFSKLPFRWHWHIVEGVADLKHDTAWSLKNGGYIPEAMHTDGLSNDGTSEYLDYLSSCYPDKITIYRKSNGFWDGKIEMVNAPLTNINEECLLWQIDADELWTAKQFITCHKIFSINPEKMAAYFYCTLFVGPDLIVSNRNTFGNMSEYEWLRVWKYKPCDRWISHEPPSLGRRLSNGTLIEIESINSIMHEETSALDLVFQHHAYVTEKQVNFKEKYYAYPGLVDCWRDMQNAEQFPVQLDNYFRFQKRTEAIVDKASSMNIEPLIRNSNSLAHVAENQRKGRCWCNGCLNVFSNPHYEVCDVCGTLVYVTEVSEERLKTFYSEDFYWNQHQKNVGNYPDIKQRSISDFSDRIPAWYQILKQYKFSFDSILEIGCAHGGFLHYCREQGTSTVVGVEVDEATCVFARGRFGLPYVYSGLFPNVTLPFTQYDVVCSFDVIEHFADPVHGLRKMVSLLKEDGILFIQTPCYRGEGADWSNLKPEEHLFLFGEQSLRLLFSVCGLEVVNILPGYFSGDCFIIGRKLPIKRILYIRVDTIGDAVLAFPVLPYIKQQYPDSILTVMCQQHIAELYDACPHVNSVIPVDILKAYKQESYREILLSKIHAFDPDLAINGQYYRSLLNEYFCVGSFAKLLVGFQGSSIVICSELGNSNNDVVEKNNKFFNRLIPSYAKTEFARNNDLLSGLGISHSEMEPIIWTTPEDELFAEEFFRSGNLDVEKTLALFPAGRHGQKFYPHYPEALNGLCQKENLTVLALGTESDKENIDNLLKHLKVPSVRLCGELTLRQLAAILRRCKVALGADTGTAHIACAVGTRNVVVMWGGHFGKFFPYSPLTSIVCLPLDCYGCNWQCHDRRWRCIDEIPPEVVAVATIQTFTSSAAKARIFVPKGWRGENSHHFAPDKLSMLDNLNEVEIIAVDLI